MALARSQDLSKIGEAYVALLDAMDLLRLTPREIKSLARALRKMRLGQSFTLTVKTTEGKLTELSVPIIYVK